MLIGEKVGISLSCLDGLMASEVANFDEGNSGLGQPRTEGVTKIMDAQVTETRSLSVQGEPSRPIQISLKKPLPGFRTQFYKLRH